MKKTLISIVVIAIVIILIVLLGRGSSTVTLPGNTTSTGSTTTVVTVAETTKVSNKTSKFENAELGFSVNYPSAWEHTNTATGVVFVTPTDSSQVSTIAKLESDIVVNSEKCAFPPVTTIKERGTIKVGSNTLNMISMSNNVQGRSYFNRMYSLQLGSICYYFTFSSIALSPESKKLTGSNLTQAQNNNKAIVSTADADFTAMVKTFAIVQGPAGIDETKAAPAH